MTTPQRTDRADPAREGPLRRPLIIWASVAAVLSLLHFVDHAIRGELVVSRGLDPDWNHSGWPFNTLTDAPYIFPISFVVVSGLLLGGILFTLRGRLWAGYWLGTSIFVTALLVFVHFVGFSAGAAETPTVIAMSHSNAVGSVLALVDLFGLFAAFAALAFQAVRTRQRSGHW
ncbi:MAG: hypothetical protein ACR2P2_08880 [Nakamurella sp.]